jgi:hypothetical protein
MHDQSLFNYAGILDALKVHLVSTSGAARKASPNQEPPKGVTSVFSWFCSFAPKE